MSTLNIIGAIMLSVVVVIIIVAFVMSMIKDAEFRNDMIGASIMAGILFYVMLGIYFLCKKP